MLLTITASIFVFGILVLVHEFGHFITAKMVGMKVEEFALGFGPKLIGIQYGETLYSVRAVPLGGFNKIAGMDPDEEQDERSFNSKPVWARIAVFFAGSAMNFVLPVVLFSIIFYSGGIDMPVNDPIVGKVVPNKAAALAGLDAGDKILSVAGTEVTTWEKMVSIIQVNSGNNVPITYQRNGNVYTTSLTPEYDPGSKRGIIGIFSHSIHYQPGFFEAIKLACNRTWEILVSMVSGIIQMVTGRAAADVSGPIGIAQMAGEVAQLGLLPLLSFTALLSLNIGIFNLLPVPVLDGGHITVLFMEGLRGKPFSRKLIQYTQIVGFALLIGLLIMALYKDATTKLPWKM